MSFLKKLLPFVVIILLVSSCKQENKSISNIDEPIKFKNEGVLEILNDSISIVKLNIEIADDEYERQTGLMYRTSLDEKQAMLFIFEDEKPRSFYMKNTYVPLDIIFINADNKIVSISENTKATDESSIPSNAPAKYVLEINAGLTQKWHIEPGNTIKYSVHK